MRRANVISIETGFNVFSYAVRWDAQHDNTVGRLVIECFDIHGAGLLSEALNKYALGIIDYDEAPEQDGTEVLSAAAAYACRAEVTRPASFEPTLGREPELDGWKPIATLSPAVAEPARVRIRHGHCDVTVVPVSDLRTWFNAHRAAIITAIEEVR